MWLELWRKIKQERGQRVRGRVLALVDRVVKEGITEQLVFEESSEGHGRAALWGKCPMQTE